jgi:PhnB protein
MQTSTYLHFRGECAEAFGFYAELFGGKIEFTATFAQAPDQSQVPPEAANKIMHAQLQLGSQKLLGCDALGSHYHPPQGFSVMAAIDEPKEAERVFAALAQGGSVRMPVQETFWAHRFGMCVDRFGIPWMVNCAKQTDFRDTAGRSH